MGALSHIAFFVGDLSVMSRFYVDLFGMRITWQNEEKAYLTTGKLDILGLLVGDPNLNAERANIHDLEIDGPSTPNFFHFGFVAERREELNEIIEKLNKKNIPIVGPKISRDGTVSIYFCDPEGNALQAVLPPRDYFAEPR